VERGFATGADPAEEVIEEGKRRLVGDE